MTPKNRSVLNLIVLFSLYFSAGCGLWVGNPREDKDGQDQDKTGEQGDNEIAQNGPAEQKDEPDPITEIVGDLINLKLGFPSEFAVRDKSGIEAGQVKSDALTLNSSFIRTCDEGSARFFAIERSFSLNQSNQFIELLEQVDGSLGNSLCLDLYLNPDQPILNYEGFYSKNDTPVKLAIPGERIRFSRKNAQDSFRLLNKDWFNFSFQTYDFADIEVNSSIEISTEAALGGSRALVRELKKSIFVDDAAAAIANARQIQLSNQGAVARYFLAETAEKPDSFQDSLNNSINLTARFRNDNHNKVETIEIQTGRGVDVKEGMTQSFGYLDGLADTAYGTQLQGSRQITLELVLNIFDCPNNDTRIVSFGDGSGDSEDFAVGCSYGRRGFFLSWKNQKFYSNFRIQDLGRSVYTFQVDTTEENPEERFKLYVNGRQILGLESIPQNDQLSISASSQLHLGSKGNNDSPIAEFFYFSMYNRILTDEEKRLHSSRLLYLDD